MPGDLALVERFHFLFLERLLRMSRADLYVLKGGVNLRFFHGSPRYSEDMDLDVHDGRVSVETLKKNGYKILNDAAFRRILATVDIVNLDVNDPARAKHTDTTQRFRLSLVLTSGQRLPTKVELSRRGIDMSEARLERIDPEVARRHHRSAYQVWHYAAAAASRQKILALAGRRQPQARDAFDLYLLDSRGGVTASLLRSMDRKVLERAAANLSQLDEDDWQGQVVEYLEHDLVDEFRGSDRFERLQLELIDRLESR